MPSMAISVAFVVCQVKVDDCPLSIASGLALNDAVGSAGAGGGGGGGGGVFLWHAPRNRIEPSANTSADPLNVSCFNFPPCSFVAPLDARFFTIANLSNTYKNSRSSASN